VGVLLLSTTFLFSLLCFLRWVQTGLRPIVVVVVLVVVVVVMVVVGVCALLPLACPCTLNRASACRTDAGFLRSVQLGAHPKTALIAVTYSWHTDRVCARVSVWSARRVVSEV